MEQHAGKGPKPVSSTAQLAAPPLPQSLPLHRCEEEPQNMRHLTSATVRIKYIDGCCGSIPSSFIPTLKPFLCWEATWYWKQKLNYNVKNDTGSWV